MNRIFKWITVTAAILIVIFIIASGLIGNYFYTLALDPRADKSAVLQADHNANGSQEINAQAEQELHIWWEDVGYEDAYRMSDDGLNLHSYVIDTFPDSKKWAILVHGYTGNALQMRGTAQQFYRQGFQVLMPDMRGHGMSEGDYIGMGWDDRLDVIGWIEEILTGDPEAEIVLYGVSMGGATVMMTAGEDLPANVKAIVEDCGYSSIWDEFSYQLESIYGLPDFPIMHASSLVTRIRAGYSLTEGDAVEQVAKSKTPIFFIHGDADTFVPYSMLDQVYNAATVEKDKLIVPGAGHGEASAVAKDIYWDAIFGFINRFVS